MLNTPELFWVVKVIYVGISVKMYYLYLATYAYSRKAVRWKFTDNQNDYFLF